MQYILIGFVSIVLVLLNFVVWAIVSYFVDFGVTFALFFVALGISIGEIFLIFMAEQEEELFTTVCRPITEKLYERCNNWKQKDK